MLDRQALIHRETYHLVVRLEQCLASSPVRLIKYNSSAHYSGKWRRKDVLEEMEDSQAAKETAFVVDEVSNVVKGAVESAIVATPINTVK